MKYHIIDNTLKNLGKTVLWQYDRATRLLSILKHMQVLYHCAVEQFWDFWQEKVLAVDTISNLGCAIWGLLLGVPRPKIKLSDGEERLIVASVYRKVLKGKFLLLRSGYSFANFLNYIEVVFGLDGKDSFSQWQVQVSETGWYTNIDELNADRDVRAEYYPRLAYKKGIIFYNTLTDDNWECLTDISVSDNPSFDVLLESGKIQATMKEATILNSDSSLLLKLYDPEGICRRIVGAPRNALSITLEYKFGETTITAAATRSRKCGLTLTDNGDMSITYGKSIYYDEMHRDQKALFEQKPDEFLPYPLGIKTNQPMEEVIFGFSGQENERYQVGKAYNEGDIFGYVERDEKNIKQLYREFSRGGPSYYLDSLTNAGVKFNWKCKKNITAEENTSFETIRPFLEKTKEGDPFIGCCEDGGPPFIDYRDMKFPYCQLRCVPLDNFDTELSSHRTLYRFDPLRLDEKGNIFSPLQRSRAATGGLRDYLKDPIELTGLLVVLYFDARFGFVVTMDGIEYVCFMKKYYGQQIIVVENPSLSAPQFSMYKIRSQNIIHIVIAVPNRFDKAGVLLALGEYVNSNQKDFIIEGYRKASQITKSQIYNPYFDGDGWIIEERYEWDRNPSLTGMLCGIEITSFSIYRWGGAFYGFINPPYHDRPIPCYSTWDTTLGFEKGSSQTNQGDE